VGSGDLIASSTVCSADGFGTSALSNSSCHLARFAATNREMNVGIRKIDIVN
jgi:hypothetical protein